MLKLVLEDTFADLLRRCSSPRIPSPALLAGASYDPPSNVCPPPSTGPKSLRAPSVSPEQRPGPERRGENNSPADSSRDSDSDSPLTTCSAPPRPRATLDSTRARHSGHRANFPASEAWQHWCLHGRRTQSGAGDDSRQITHVSAAVAPSKAPASRRSADAIAPRRKRAADCDARRPREDEDEAFEAFESESEVSSSSAAPGAREASVRRGATARGGGPLREDAAAAAAAEARAPRRRLLRRGDAAAGDDARGEGGSPSARGMENASRGPGAPPAAARLGRDRRVLASLVFGPRARARLRVRRPGRPSRARRGATKVSRRRHSSPPRTRPGRPREGRPRERSRRPRVPDDRTPSPNAGRR